MSSPHTDEQVSRLLYRVGEAAVMLSLSRAKVYELISRLDANCRRGACAADCHAGRSTFMFRAVS